MEIDLLSAFNCFRYCAIIVLMILIDIFHNYETLKILSIISIIVIVFSFACCKNNPRRRQRVQRLTSPIALDIIRHIDTTIIREYLELIRTRTVCYRLGKKDPHIGEECCICLDEFKFRSKVCRLECCHLYHKKCVEQWLIESPVCPLCKYDIYEELDIIIDVNDDEELDIIYVNDDEDV